MYALEVRDEATGRFVPVNSPYLVSMERSLKSRMTTGAVRSRFMKESAAPTHPGSLEMVAERQGVTSNGWWFEKIDAAGEYEGVLLVLLAGSADSHPSAAMMFLTSRYYTARGEPVGSYAAHLPALKIASDGLKAIQSMVPIKD